MSLLRNCNWLSKCLWKSYVPSTIVYQQKLSFSSQVDLESLYISPKVQELLKNITGFDMDKILSSKAVSTPEAPQYKLLTDEQLKKLQDESHIKAQKYLQMPPFKKALDYEASKNQILSHDKEIALFDKRDRCSFVFTDISANLHKRERTVVIRESSGILRLADLKEKDRILQVYYPDPNKTLKVPEMFDEERLEELLSPDYYAYILDRALVQFEPDNPNYVRVTQRTYEHILTTKEFHQFRSTRHFGPMAFYYLIFNKIDVLLCDMLTRDLIDDAVHLVQLYSLVHPESDTRKELKTIGFNDKSSVLQTYLSHDCKDKVIVELTLNSCLTRNAPEEVTSSN